MVSPPSEKKKFKQTFWGFSVYFDGEILYNNTIFILFNLNISCTFSNWNVNANELMVFSKIQTFRPPLICCFSASVPVPVGVCVCVKTRQAADRMPNQWTVCLLCAQRQSRCRALFYIKTKCRGLLGRPLKKHTHTHILLFPCLNLYLFASIIAVGSLVFFFFFPNRVGRILTDLFIWIRYKLSLPGLLQTLRTFGCFLFPPFPRIAHVCHGDVFLFLQLFF